VWKVTGQSANSEPGRLFPRGYFYVASQHGLPDGTWKLRVVRHHRTLGSSSVTITREHC
jgi:hypothetical protein